ncbi:MAG TPA: DUF3828 domain-containing protein [Sphingomicrobium sp.]|nr:DUF3828 domain-containing protein [Sphingomicrobium sp.]
MLAAAAFDQSPRDFVQRIYSSYRDSTFSPLVHPETIFAPRLSAAIRKDQEFAQGEVGFVDGDPLCDCQDTGGMRSRIISVTASGPRAVARVSIRFSGTNDSRDLRLKLIRTAAGWRIADVGTHDERSLLEDLLKANRTHVRSSRRR